MTTIDTPRLRAIAAGAALLCSLALPLSAHADVISTGPGPDHGGGITLDDTGT